MADIRSPTPDARAATPDPEDAAAHRLIEAGSDSDDGGMMGEVGRQRSSSAPSGDPMLRDAAKAATKAAASKPSSSKRNISVIARFRPENALEVANGGENCVEYDADGKTVTVKVDGSRHDQDEKHRFAYHKVFPSYATQEDVFDYMGDSTVDAFVSGINCSVMAYGQTGTGKTYTMMGVTNRAGAVVSHQGIIPRIFNRLFNYMSRNEDTTIFKLDLSFVELYMERIQDLLVDTKRDVIGNKPAYEKKHDIRDVGDGTLTVTDCTYARTHTMGDAMAVVQTGLERRSTAATKSNIVSSRSHAILIVTLQSEERFTKKHRSSQLYLVDLAGSEKVAKTETFGMRLEEAKMINRSLFTLGQVINALTEKKKGKSAALGRIPYRDSKLTRLLQNSLGGNALTHVIITCSPSSFNDQETLSSLRFGAKAQMITTTPVKNIHRSVEELEYLLLQAQDEINNQRATIGMLKNQMKSLQASRQNQVNVGDTGNGKKGGGKQPATTTPASQNRLMNYVMESRLSTIISSCLTCPIYQRPMRDPVVCLDGYTYERRAIANYFMEEENALCSPITGQRVSATLLVPNLLMRSLFEMCKEEGLLIDPDRGTTVGAPVSCWDVVDVMGVIFDFVPHSDLLRYAQINITSARAIYDKERWQPLIEKEMMTSPATLIRQVNNLALPAHKIYLILSNVLSPEERQEALQRCVYASSNLALYSSGLAKRPPKKK